jgi:hypothetical protein
MKPKARDLKFDPAQAFENLRQQAKKVLALPREEFERRLTEDQQRLHNKRQRRRK